MIFDVNGPFKLSRHTPKQIITKDSLKELKLELDEREDGLSDACGCYVFAIRAGKGYTPYYVGQACRRPIADEALNSSNREKYNKALSESKGTPVLFLLPMRTPNLKLRKRKKAEGNLSVLEFLEEWLIAAAIDKNPDLINNRKTRFLRNIHIRGILNAERGEATKDSALLRATLWT
jgi:hypothetical protein